MNDLRKRGVYQGIKDDIKGKIGNMSVIDVGKDICLIINLLFIKKSVKGRKEQIIFNLK